MNSKHTYYYKLLHLDIVVKIIIDYNDKIFFTNTNFKKKVY